MLDYIFQNLRDSNIFDAILATDAALTPRRPRWTPIVLGDTATGSIDGLNIQVSAEDRLVVSILC